MAFASSYGTREVWIPEAAPQCERCLSGQVAAALKLLLRDPQPSSGEVSHVLATACQCGAEDPSA